MSAEESLTEQGIAAYEAGNNREASRLFQEAVKEDKTDATAWYYLAQLTRSDNKRRQLLETVLKIEPDHADAQRQLAELESKVQPEETPEVKEKSPTTEPADAQPGAGGGLLRAIPGAPDAITPKYLSEYTQLVLTRGLATLTRQAAPGTVPSWWDFWLTAALVSFVNGLLFDIGAIIIAIRFDTTPDILALITLPFITVVTGTAAVAAGAYASYWYATRQERGRGSLLDHSDAMVSIWAPAALLTGILIVLEALFRGNVLTLETLLLRFIPDMSSADIVLTLIALAVTAYALFLMSKDVEEIHRLRGRAVWIAPAIMLAITALIF